MRGHEPIIQMRMAGRAPSIVFLNDHPTPEAKDWINPGEKFGQVWEPDHATVCIHGEPLSSIDLRFLTGLRVSISADDMARAKSIFARVKLVGAKTVAAACGDWTEIFHKEEKQNG